MSKQANGVGFLPSFVPFTLTVLSPCDYSQEAKIAVLSNIKITHCVLTFSTALQVRPVEQLSPL